MKGKISFIDFWNGFDPRSDKVFSEMISKYELVISNPENCDILFFSVFGNQNNKYRNKFRVLYSAENLKRFRKDYNYDFSITMEKESNSNILLPNYIRRYGFEIQNDMKINKGLSNPKNKFCSFFSSHPYKMRDSVFREINKIKKIDSFGRHLNNTNEIIPKDVMNDYKIKKMEEYNFNLCFENSKSDFYFTEKIVDSFRSSSIPIYWGANKINDFFNKDSFINYSNFDSTDHLMDYILNLSDDKIKDIINIHPIKYFFKKEDFYEKVYEKIIK